MEDLENEERENNVGDAKEAILSQVKRLEQVEGGEVERKVAELVVCQHKLSQRVCDAYAEDGRKRLEQ